MKKIAALLLSFLLLTSALAELNWTWSDSDDELRQYITAVNDLLATQQSGEINMVYEIYPSFASFGMNGEETPETTEMYFLLGSGHLHSLTLRICDPDLFEKAAAACLTAASSGIFLEDALTLTASYADILRQDLAAASSDPQNAMTHSFEEPVNDLQGNQPRAYFAYYPNQYGDGKHWLQMTLIFARPGSTGGALSVADATPAPSTDVEYEGYFSQDNYNHLEIFATPTPEPDSAAMEDW